MADEASQSNESLPPTNVQYGEFPFPLIDGPEESRYLTWLRNHSNYMAVRGLLDYLRSVGVLVRGIIVNFLIFLPYLLIVAIVLGYSHHQMLDHPFLVTLVVLVFALAWILLFPILMPLFKIFSYKRSLETGSESTVKQRDLYERSFGGLLLVILAVALLESLPWLLELFHDLLHSENFGWQGSVATVTGALAFLSGADKILSSVSGAKKAVAMVLIGIVGLLVPLMVILYATDFLLYGPPPGPTVMYSPLLVAVVGVLAILIAIPLGLSRRAFSPRECAGVVGLLVAGLVLAAVVIIGINWATNEVFVKGNEKLGAIIEPLERVASQFDKISNRDEMEPEVAALVEEVAIAERDYKIMQKSVDEDAEQYMKSHLELITLYEEKFQADDEKSRDKSFVHSLRQLYAEWMVNSKEADFMARYFKSGQQFISLGDKLAAQPRGSLEPLRREIAKLAYDKLLEELRKKVANEEELAQLLRKTLVEQKIRQPRSNDVPNLDADFPNFDEELTHVRDRLKQLGEQLDPVETMRKAKRDLQDWSIEEIAKLVGEERLAAEVEEKFKQLPGKAKLTRLAGRDELAKLLTKEELVNLMLAIPGEFPSDGPELEKLAGELKNLTRTELIKAALPRAAINLAVLAGGQKTTSHAEKVDSAADVKQEDPAVTNEPSAIAEVPENAPAEKTGDGEGPDSEPAPAVEPPELNDTQAIDLELENVTAAEIANLAREELARMALADFDVKHLTVVLSDAMRAGRLEVRVKLQEVEAAEEREFDALERLAQRLTLEELAKDAFEKVTEDAIEESALSDDGTNLDSETEIVTSKLHFSPPDKKKLLLAQKALGYDSESLAKLAREILIEKALGDSFTAADEPKRARRELGELCTVGYYGNLSVPLTDKELARIAVARFGDQDSMGPDAPDKLVSTLMFGKFGPLERGEAGNQEPGDLANVKEELTEAVILPKAVFIFLLAAVIGLAGWLTVDVNLTSIHGLYRDRLASAFLVGQDTKGDVDIEQDVDLADLCRYEARSVAPYHLVNAALNLQGSKDIGIRERNSDCFIFSKRFIGGQRTGYCRSDVMDQVYPQMSLATAMAISAAAASPNMGRGTSPLLVAFMALLNIRLGYWMPNPGLLEEKLNEPHWKRRKKDPNRARDPLGFTFDEVFAEELKEIQGRWSQVYSDSSKRQLHLTADEPTVTPTTEHGLVGIGFSGGGIRSASINLGIAQALHKRGAFDHVDYMSTVSGGGYLGSSISTLMRSREKLVSEIDGTVSIEPLDLVSAIDGTVSKYVNVVVTSGEDVSVQRTYRFSADAELNVYDKENISAGTPLLKPRATKNQSEIAGTANANNRERTVKIQGVQSNENREYRFSKFDWLIVKTGDVVKAGNELIQRHNTVGERFRWRVRPSAFLREMCSKLDETHDWVNVSDGGHIENLATIELLRRRCKYIIVGDGEADPKLHFAGLATLMRTAYIDLGVKIKIDLDDLRLRKANEEDDEPTVSKEHWAIGKITYPKTSEGGNDEEGYLLYLKSSFTGDEIEVIREYRQRNPTFPHQSTADQMFDEGQFEAYRALGQHIGEQALKAPGGAIPAGKMAFGDLKRWFEENWKAKEERADEKVKKK